MTNWKRRFTPEADKDMDKLAGNQRKVVFKAINKVLENPLPFTEGGYGKPLGNKHGYNLTGYCEIKLRGQGLRVIYKLEKDEMVMLNIVVDKRSDEEVYRIAFERLKNMQNED